MRTYWYIFTAALQEMMAHRLNILLEVLGNVFTTLVAIALWVYVFRAQGGGVIGGYTEGQMITYLIIAGFLTWTFWLTAQGDEIADDIYQGMLSAYLVKPLRISWYYFSRNLASKVLPLSAALVVLGIMMLWAGKLIVLHVTPFSFLAFLLFLPLALVLHFFIFYPIALLAFWMEEVWGINYVARVMAEVAAGSFLPLTLFAPGWRTLFDALPFRYIVGVPTQILLGTISQSDMWEALLGALIWLVILFCLGMVLLRRGIQHYRAVGG